MSQLHPIFAMALEPFAPLLANNLTSPSVIAPWLNQLKNKDGTPVSSALQAQFDKTYPLPCVKAARKSTDSFSYCLAGVDLECELDFERESGDGWNEPREPENAILCEAFCGDTDIIEILSDEQKEEIEIAYLETDRSDV